MPIAATKRCTHDSLVSTAAYVSKSAAGICDQDGRLVVYRAYAGKATDAANACAMEAARYLDENIIPISSKDTDSKRGSFNQFYFILHQESTPVSQLLTALHPKHGVDDVHQKTLRLSRYFLDNYEAGLRVAEILHPLSRLIDGK